MSAPRYRAPDAGALRIVPLDEIVAVYHRPSAQTHLVVSPVPEMLDALAGEWSTAQALMARLAARFDMPDGDPVALAERLEELVGIGLVERG